MGKNAFVISDSEEEAQAISTALPGSGDATPSTAATSVLGGAIGAALEFATEIGANYWIEAPEVDMDVAENHVGDSKITELLATSTAIDPISTTTSATTSTSVSKKKTIRATIVLSDSDEEMKPNSVASSSVVKKVTKTMTTTKRTTIAKSLAEGEVQKVTKKVAASIVKKSIKKDEDTVASSSKTIKKSLPLTSKGKGKARVVDSDAESEFEDAQDAREETASSAVDPAARNSIELVDSDQDELASDGDAENGDGPKKIPPRKGAKVPPEMKKTWKKRTKYEKSKIMLNLNHPELENCWEKLAASPTPVAMHAVQPEGFSLKLLPFQLEGLDWMMKQEASECTVGCSLTRWEWARQLRLSL